MMKGTKLTGRCTNKAFNFTETQTEVQKLIDKVADKKLRTIRLDPYTIIQIDIRRDNCEAIINKVRNRARKIQIVAELEYGQYA